PSHISESVSKPLQSCDAGVPIPSIACILGFQSPLLFSDFRCSNHVIQVFQSPP
ncbi:unnamed protein product, partial [Staurois parvus]